MNEVSIELSDTAMEQIKSAAEKKGIEPEKMIQAILLEWAMKDMVFAI